MALNKYGMHTGPDTLMEERQRERLMWMRKPGSLHIGDSYVIRIILDCSASHTLCPGLLMNKRLL